MMKKLAKILSVVFVVLALMLTAVVPAFAVNLEQDGEYTVNVYLVQKDKDKDTPASDGVLRQAKVVVKDGKSTMYIYTQPVTVIGQTSTLKGMTVFKTPDATDSGTQAAVVSKNSSGEPNCFSFELPHTNEFLRIRVDTGLKIPGEIGARLKVDWASLALVNAYTTEAQTEPETEAPEAADESAPAEEPTTEITTVAENTEADTEPAVDDFLQAPEETVTDAESATSPTMVIVIAAVAVVVIAAVVVVIVKKKKK